MFVKNDFFTACENGDTQKVREILDKRDNNNLNDIYAAYTPFLIACKNGHHEIVEILLNDERIDVAATDSFGNTGLHLAVANNNCGEVIKKLLASPKINAAALNILNLTPLIALSQRVMSTLNEEGKEYMALLLKHPRTMNNMPFYGHIPVYL